jgi:type IV secretory pathway protease TraF
VLCSFPEALGSPGVRLNLTSLAQAFGSDGRPLPSLSLGRYVVRGGELWLMGRHTLSFVSRYFGPVASSGVLAVTRPVWLFGGK